MMIMLMTMVTTTDAEAKQPCEGHPAGTPAGYNLAAGTRAARKPAGHNRAAGTRTARNPAARNPAARNSAAHNSAAHNPAAHNPAAHCSAARCSLASFARRFARGRVHRRLAHPSAAGSFAAQRCPPVQSYVPNGSGLRLAIGSTACHTEYVSLLRMAVGSQSNTIMATNLATCEDGSLRVVAVQADLVAIGQRTRVGP